MHNIAIHITIIALLISVACVLPGTFLVLRGVALMSDAISHAIVPGIVIMFFMVKQLSSPLLLCGASCAGLATVLLTEHIIQTKRLKKDAAIGLVYPLFFSVGIILMSLYTRNIHLDADMVLLGELAFAPFDRFMYGGYDLGPHALWTMGMLMLCNLLFVWRFYKELTLSTFDPILAQLIGYKPQRLYYMLMGCTSITAVCAFNVVGSIVVVALMLIPPAAAYLITQQLKPMLITSIVFAMSASLIGCSMAAYGDISVAGSLAVANGSIFFCMFILSLALGTIF